MGAYDPKCQQRGQEGNLSMHLNTAYWFIESTKQLGIRLSNGLACSKPNNSGIMSHIRQAAKTL